MANNIILTTTDGRKVTRPQQKLWVVGTRTYTLFSDKFTAKELQNYQFGYTFVNKKQAKIFSLENIIANTTKQLAKLKPVIHDNLEDYG